MRGQPGCSGKYQTDNEDDHVRRAWYSCERTESRSKLRSTLEDMKRERLSVWLVEVVVAFFPNVRVANDFVVGPGEVGKACAEHAETMQILRHPNAGALKEGHNLQKPVAMQRDRCECKRVRVLMTHYEHS